MKNFLVVFLFSFIFFKSQSQIIQFNAIDDLKVKGTYCFKAKLDSTIVEYNFMDTLVLLAGERQSRFVSTNVLSVQQTMAGFDEGISLVDVARKTIENLPSIRPFVRFEVFKNRTTNLITRIDLIDGLYIKTEEPLNDFEWKILPETKTLFGYKIQKATTKYGCRDWVAWFAPDLPFNEGPYKFNGLPGLILKISDTKGNFVFEICGFDLAEKGDKILQLKEVESYPLVTREGFVKARLANRRLHPGRQDSPQNNMPRPHLPVNPIELCAD